MKKVRKLFSLAFIAVVAAMMSLLTACGDDSTVYLTVRSDDVHFEWWHIALIVVAAVVVISLIATVIVLIAVGKEKKRRAAEEAEDTVVLTQDPNAVSEYYFDDEKTEAAPAEEAPAEETPAEEPVDEEAVTETEEAPEETEPEEIVEEVADASFAEEATEEKAEIVEETATEEAPAEEALEAEVEKEPEYTLDANGLPVAPEGMVIRYKWSFLARLIQSDDELKFRYMKLRRKLLSYKKVRSSVSWNFDSYFIGRKPIVKLKVRGKTLVAYFPFDPQEMAGTKYIGEDFSGVARYKAVPFAYRINGARKLKYAFELIERQLTGIKFTDPVYLDESQMSEAIPRESFKKLFEKGYVRVGGVLAVGDRAPKNDDDDDDDVITVENDAEVEAEFSELREEFNFNPKAQ